MFLSNLIVLVCNFCFSNSAYNKANIFLDLIEYELNSLLGASHLVDYISIHIRFDLERYLLNREQLNAEGDIQNVQVEFDAVWRRFHLVVKNHNQLQICWIAIKNLYTKIIFQITCSQLSVCFVESITVSSLL